MSAPWDFANAEQASRLSSQLQKRSEQFLIDTARTAAKAEESYRCALATEIVRQHNEDGVAWSVAPDLARGNQRVARLRMERDIAEGVREAATQAAWRAAADRKDVGRFLSWSERAAFRDEPDDEPGVTFGARRAA